MNECISDRCYNYLQRIRANFHNDQRIQCKTDQEEWNQVLEIYKNLRVDLFLGNHNPSITAAAIFNLVYSPMYSLTMRDISDYSGHAEYTITKKRKLISDHLKNTNSYIPYYK